MTNVELQKLMSQAGQLRQQKKWDDCIARLTKYISLQDDPRGQSVAYLNRGIAHSNKDEDDQAFEDYNRAADLDVDNALVYLGRGAAYSIKGEDDQAFEDYNRAIDLDVNDATVYLGRGAIYSKKSKHGLAFRNYLCAVEKDKNLKSLYPRAYLAAQIKDIFEDDEKGVESFKLFDSLYAAITKIKEVRLSKPIDGNEIAHYTSLHTLKKLVDEETSSKKEECFRLYNADYMNDPEEGRTFFDIMKQENRKIDVESLFYPNNKETPYPSSAYIGSFVIVDSDRNEDQGKDKLFLWRTYGKHDLEEAAGACLIFKHEDFLFAKNPQFEISAMLRQQPPKPALYKIAYLSCCKKGKLAVALGELVKSLGAVVSFYNESKDNQKVALAKLVRELLDDIRFLFKADHYKEEHEVRVVKMDYSEIGQTGTHIDTEQFPPRFYLKSLKDCRFHEVILGPQVRGVSEWKRWLIKRGIENVGPSGIRYRTQ